VQLKAAAPSQAEELKRQLRTDEKGKCAVTEKLTFEICASLIAFEVKTILGTISRPGVTTSGKKPSNLVKKPAFF